MDRLVDLHTHSNYSDGELSPDELIKHAVSCGVEVMAITDHDTINGIKSVNKDSYSEIKIIDGIELSAKSKTGRMHILGYRIDLDNKDLNRKMSELRDNSINSVLSIMEQIKRDYGIVFRYDDIRELILANHNLGRPDLAKICVKYGYADSIQDAFDRYLVDAYNKTRSTSRGLEYSECFDLILSSGGIPVLAHPKSLELSNDELDSLLKRMVSCGLMGIEVYHSSHSSDEMEFYNKLANKYELLVSGGSDFHGSSVKPDIEIGTGYHDNVKVKKLSILERL